MAYYHALTLLNSVIVLSAVEWTASDDESLIDIGLELAYRLPDGPFTAVSNQNDYPAGMKPKHKMHWIERNACVAVGMPLSEDRVLQSWPLLIVPDLPSQEAA